MNSLYEKINLDQSVIKRYEFKKIIDRIEEYNKEKIEVFRKIILNTDVTLRFKEYCAFNKSPKEGASNEYDRTKKIIDLFFYNVA